MKTKYHLTITILLFVVHVNFSCKKEKSCEGCKENNKPPTAIAGPDRVITLPTDSVLLDGTASSDPDGTISEWLWAKISGPASFGISNTSVSRAVIKNLTTGVYQFELKITDNGGLSSKDTVQVTVNPLMPGNRPPVANAGADQAIILPANTVTFDGSASTDPDNNIINYVWVKISGPTSFNITNENASQTSIINLVQGLYQFELKVTDAGGLFSKDTVLVTVNPGSTTIACGSTRPEIIAQLIPIGTLSETRSYTTAAAAGNKIVFAGGSIWPVAPYASSRADIYDIVTQTWSTAELSTPRWQMATATAGNKIFFAGGGYYDDGDNTNPVWSVDIYDASTNLWKSDSLSEARIDIAAAVVGSKVLFAGGYKHDALQTALSDKVDIYDLSLNAWSTTQLSETRTGIAAVTANNKIYFAGGLSRYNIFSNDRMEMVASDRIDIYDNSTGLWSTTSLGEARYYLAGIHVNNKIYWAGGIKTNPNNIGPQYNSCTVEIKDLNTQVSRLNYLSSSMHYYINGAQNAVVKGNKIIFFTGSRYTWVFNDHRKFDIYDFMTNTWSVGVLPVSIKAASIISVNNTIYVAGGMVNDVLSNTVYKLEF